MFVVASQAVSDLECAFGSKNNSRMYKRLRFWKFVSAHQCVVQKIMWDEESGM